MSDNKKITECDNSRDIMYPIYIGKRWSHFSDDVVKRNKILLNVRSFLPLVRERKNNGTWSGKHKKGYDFSRRLCGVTRAKRGLKK